MAENAVEVRQGNSEMLSVRDVRLQINIIQELMQGAMQKDIHYGVIPGTDKPTLLKPGAEKIGLLFKLAPSFQRQTSWEGPHLTVMSECTLTHSPSGRVIASAGGLCSTKETKYAYRQATRKCPVCGKPAIIKGKEEYGGGWLCYKKKEGCGEKFDEKDPAITGQASGREENPNLADTYNTVLKMADKRALVAATLMGTAASDIYTQDIEDMQEDAPAASNGPHSPVTTKGQPESSLGTMSPMPGRGEERFVNTPLPHQDDVNDIVLRGIAKEDQAHGLRKAMEAVGAEPESIQTIRQLLNDAGKTGIDEMRRVFKAHQKQWKADHTPEEFTLIQNIAKVIAEGLDKIPYPSGEDDVQI